MKGELYPRVPRHLPWTRLMYFDDAARIDEKLQDAVEDLVRDLSVLAEKHAAAAGEFPARVTHQSSSSASDQGKTNNPTDAGAGCPAQTGPGTSGTAQEDVGNLHVGEPQASKKS